MLSCSNKLQNTVTIAAAANMQYVLKDLVHEFNKDEKIHCEIVLGSSGKLTAQIEASAPFDVFLSANAKYPKYLKNENKEYANPKTYAYGRLAVFSNNFKVDSLSKILTSTQVKKIAIPNPKTAPYGQMAKEFLQNLNVYSSIEHKLVYGESVMQSNQFVVSGAADVGFTAISSLKAEIIKNTHSKSLNENLYTPIQQQLLVLKANNNTEKFANFMLSEKAQNILKKYGYGSIQ